MALPAVPTLGGTAMLMPTATSVTPSIPATSRPSGSELPGGASIRWSAPTSCHDAASCPRSIVIATTDEKTPMATVSVRTSSGR